MNSFWSNLYDGLKDRRYAGLFLTSLAAFFGLLALAAVVFMIICASDLPEHYPYALPGVGLVAAAWTWRVMRRARADRRERLPYSPLSRDELRVARSKLRNGMAGPERPVPRVPDTDLRY
jgi:hypothetical protein